MLVLLHLSQRTQADGVREKESEKIFRQNEEFKSTKDI